MTREQLIEAMARASSNHICEEVGADVRWDTTDDADREELRKAFAAALTALETALPGIADVISGKAVVVPVEPSVSMVEAAIPHISYEIDPPSFSSVLAACRAMIEARPK